MRFTKTILVAAVVLLVASGLSAQSILVAGTQTPFKLTNTPGGNFLLAESGTGANDGRVSLISGWGARYTLLSGLPSGVVPEGDTLGPTAVADAHGTLYVVIGEGDVRGPSPGPPQEAPPIRRASPRRSSARSSAPGSTRCPTRSGPASS